MPTVECLHCSCANDPIATAGYCDQCGKKLPGDWSVEILAARQRSGERPPVVAPPTEATDDEDLPWRYRTGSSAAAPPRMNKVAVVLLAVSGLHLLLAVIVAALMATPSLRPVGLTEMRGVTFIGVFMFVTLVFLTLGLWARGQPRPAGLVGLALYLVAAGVHLGLRADTGQAALWIVAEQLVVILAVAWALVATPASPRETTAP